MVIWLCLSDPVYMHHYTSPGQIPKSKTELLMEAMKRKTATLESLHTTSFSDNSPHRLSTPQRHFYNC